MSGIGSRGRPEHLLAQVVAVHLLGAATDSGRELVQAVELPEPLALGIVPEHALGTLHLEAQLDSLLAVPG